MLVTATDPDGESFSDEFAISTQSADSEILDSKDTTASLMVGNSVSSDIGFAFDADWFRISLMAFVEYTFELSGDVSRVDPLLDPLLRLYDINGSFIVSDNDGGVEQESRLVFTPRFSGTYYLSAEEFGNNANGSYILLATATGDPIPDATLIDTDDFFWDAEIQTSDGDVISATEAQVFRTYLGGLGRTPDSEGYDWWLNEILEGRHDLDSMAAGFVFSDEFQSIADTNRDDITDNLEFIDHIYLNVFGRQPDEGGLFFWLGELRSGTRTQANVLVDMTQSNEYVEQTLIAVVDYLVG